MINQRYHLSRQGYAPLRFVIFLIASLWLLITLTTLAQPTQTTSPSSDEPLSAQSHIVVQGDTLSKIATYYNTTVAQLVALNNLADPNLLKIGQVIVLTPETVAWPETWPEPITQVTLDPQILVQGRATMFTIESAEPAAFQATFLDKVYDFAPIPSGAHTFIVASVLQKAGVWPLELAVTRQDGTKSTLSLPILLTNSPYGREALTLTESASTLLDPDVTKAEAARVTEICASFQRFAYWEGSFAYPVDNVYHTSVFGTLRSYNGGPYRSFHRGLDLRANDMTPIYAAADGVVLLAEPLIVRGNSVIIDHGLGICSTYNHLSSLTVTQGQEVKQGDQLGLGGDTGLVTGAHLHWEVRVMGIPVDPLQWLSDIQIADIDPE